MRIRTPPTVVLRSSVATPDELRVGAPEGDVVAALVADTDVAPDACGLPRDVAIAVFWPLVVAARGDVARVLRARAATLRRADEDGAPVGLRTHLVAGGAVRVHPTVAVLLAGRRDSIDVAVRGLWSTGAAADRAAMAPWRAEADDRSPAIRPAAGLGLWELTRAREADRARVYASADELMMAWEQGLVAHDAVVPARVDGRRVDTTAGRVWLWRELPSGARFDAVDRAIDAVACAKVVGSLCAGLDAEARWRMLAALDDAGSRWLARSGLSVGMDDLRPDDSRDAELHAVREREREVCALYADGLITHAEQGMKIVDLWAGVADRRRRAYEDPRGRDVLASWRRAALLPMALHASRLVDCYGLVASPSDETLERPVLGSPAGGFDAHDAVMMAGMERAKAVRAAARLDDARMVTRALSRSLATLRVTIDDCGTGRGVAVCPWSPDERDRMGVNAPPEGRWTKGRVLAEDLRWGDGTLIAAAGSMLDATALRALHDAQVDRVRVRSPRTCEAPAGVCAQCWGAGEGAFPTVGDAVGAKVLLTLRRLLPQAGVRTFHIC